MKKPVVVNLIPTYNEKENILLMLQKLKSVKGKAKNYKFLTLVVDDNSPDGTGQLVKEYQKKNKWVYLLSGPKKGLGVAMTKGLSFAVKKLNADIVVSNEADFAYDPAKIPFMLNKIAKGYDVVVASRHVNGGGTHGWTWDRRLNHWVANKVLATWVAGTREVYDHNGAFRAIRVKGVLDKIKFKDLDVSGFGFFNYSIYKLSKVTDKFYEFPVIYKFRTRGESKVSFNPKYIKTYARDVVEYTKICLRIRSEKLQKK